MNTEKLTGKVIVITGAASGMPGWNSGRAGSSNGKRLFSKRSQSSDS